MKKGKIAAIVILVVICTFIIVMYAITPRESNPSEGYDEIHTEDSDIEESEQIDIEKEDTEDTEQESELTEEPIETNIQSIQRFLEIALEPVGSTMYIWGGGWNEADTGAGISTTQIGLYPKWKVFADKQDENYDYKKHRYELENGLDCSGYVGWVLYNTFETENGKSGYVTKAKKMAAFFAEQGWGELIENPTRFKPGDIVSMKRHVWICLGTCEDGSVLLVHSAPPGVSVCGTPSETGKKESIAVRLATEFMEEHFPEWQQKYPKRVVSSSFLKEINVFRWSDNVMSDVEKLQGMSGEEVIELLK